MSAAIEEPVSEETPSSEAAPESTSVPISSPKSGSWLESLSPDLRENPTLSKLESVEALAKEHVNAQKLIGVDKIPRPKDDWTEDQYEDFYTKIGRPANVEDYDLEGIERPEDLPWDDEFQSSMLGVMHKAGLNQSQVKQVLSAYIESIGGQYQQARGDLERSRESGVQDLRNEWGKSFDGQIDLAKRAFKAATGEGYEDVSKMVLQDGMKLGDHPAIVKAFATLGGKMNEHGLVGTSGGRTTMSPAEAGSQRNKLLADPDFLKAYMDGNHLEHSAAVKRINDLTEMEVAE